MALFLSSFPGCCTANVIRGFGIANGEGIDLSEADMKRQLDDAVEEIRDDMLGMAIAIINSEQELAEKVLEQAGFSSSGWVSKEQHPETKIKLFWKAVND